MENGLKNDWKNLIEAAKRKVKANTKFMGHTYALIFLKENLINELSKIYALQEEVIIKSEKLINMYNCQENITMETLQLVKNEQNEINSIMCQIKVSQELNEISETAIQRLEEKLKAMS